MEVSMTWLVKRAQEELDNVALFKLQLEKLENTSRFNDMQNLSDQSSESLGKIKMIDEIMQTFAKT